MSYTTFLYRLFITVYIYTLFVFLFLLTFVLQIIFIPIGFGVLLWNWQQIQLVCAYIYHHLLPLSCHPWVNPFWRITFHGNIPVHHKQRLLIMCNHVGNADVMIAPYAALPWPCRYISKADNFHIPIAGWSLYLAGDLPVHFIRKPDGQWSTDKSSVIRLMNECRRTLVEDQVAIFVFPEGLRSGDERQLLPFKPGFFRLALEQGCTILPIVTTGVNQAWPFKQRHSWLLDESQIHIQYGDAITVNATNSTPPTEEQVKQLTRHTQDTMQQILDNMHLKLQ